MESFDRVESLIEDCEYDEENDVDFNPFLNETPSVETSSSLSSEVETLDGEIVNSLTVARSLEDRERTEKISKQGNVSCQEPIPEDSLNNVQMKNSDLYSQQGGDIVREISAERTFEANENRDMIQTQKQDLMSNEEDDAICKRTRARYSLASFTLDDLEAFLQETDDEDDIPNVDDEEEYRKFLAAVLHSGDDEVQLVQSENIYEDDDEDNDVDFEIELEESLVTDDEKIIPEKVKTGDNKSTTRRPLTRHKRWKNISIQHENISPEQSGRLLRPLVPILPIAPPARMFSATEAIASSEKNTINGFTQAQMGELHCLIHEHLQLLIQVYSLCAFDHSRQHIGTQVQELISEMVQQHERYVSRRSHLLVSGSASPVLDVVDLAGRYLVDVSGGMLLG